MSKPTPSSVDEKIDFVIKHFKSLSPDDMAKIINKTLKKEKVPQLAPEILMEKIKNKLGVINV